MRGSSQIQAAADAFGPLWVGGMLPPNLQPDKSIPQAASKWDNPSNPDLKLFFQIMTVFRPVLRNVR